MNHLDTGTSRTELLTPLNAPAFSRFTFARFQRFLAVSTSGVNHFGGWHHQQPAGLLMVEEQAHDGSAQVVSICVDANLRGQGLGRQLLRHAEEELLGRGIRRLTITYMSGRPSSDAMRALLLGAGWEEPTRKHWVCTAGPRICTAPWINVYRLPAHLEVVPWVELTDAQRTHLTHASWVPGRLSPFLYEQDLDPLCSFAIVQGGEPVGWVIAQFHGEDAMIYASSYMRPDIQGRGYLIAAYAEASRRHLSHHPRKAGIWIVPMTYPPMAAFADRRMRPYLDSVDEFLTSGKSLGPSGVSSEGFTYSQQEELVCP